MVATNASPMRGGWKGGGEAKREEKVPSTTPTTLPWPTLVRAGVLLCPAVSC